MNTTNANIAATLGNIARLQDTIKGAEALLKVEREALAEALGTDYTGSIETEMGTFTISPVNTYDSKTMEAALKPGQVKRCSKTVLDTAAVKALYPDTYAASKQVRGLRITFKR